MENNDDESNIARKRRSSAVSESYSSSSSCLEQGSVDSSETELDPQRPQKRTRQVSALKYEFLSQQVAFLTNLITQHQENNIQYFKNEESLREVGTTIVNSSIDEILQPPPG